LAVLGSPQDKMMTPANLARNRDHTKLAAWLDRAASATPSQSRTASGGDTQVTSSLKNEEVPIAQTQRNRRPRRRHLAAESGTLVSGRSAENDAYMEELRRKHDALVEEERAADKEKEERRKARAKDERERRDRAAAERAQAGSSLTPRNNTPAPWPQGMPITGTADAAAHARRAAGKSASLEQVAEHSARLRKQEEELVQEDLRELKALRLAELIQRGD
jgi:hypothetical protein